MNLTDEHVLVLQDSDGDWMLLGPDQSWPGKQERVTRIVVSKA